MEQQHLINKQPAAAAEEHRYHFWVSVYMSLLPALAAMCFLQLAMALDFCLVLELSFHGHQSSPAAIYTDWLTWAINLWPISSILCPNKINWLWFETLLFLQRWIRRSICKFLKIRTLHHNMKYSVTGMAHDEELYSHNNHQWVASSLQEFWMRNLLSTDDGWW